MDPSALPPNPSALPPNPSALPSVRARALAFAAIVVAGACGALIGWGIARVLWSASAAATLFGAVLGSAAAAGGVAVVAVLVLRAMGEWRRIQAGRTAGP